MKRYISMITIAAIMGGLGVSGSAHHSTAMFNWGKEIPMKNATVERWSWTNPHTFLYVTVPTAEGTERWAFEGMSPSHLSRTGWNRHTLVPGQKIDLTYYSLRDGRKGGFNMSVTLPDGRTLRQLPARASSDNASR
mgnify:FL=1